jgi:hypothetical protein
MLVEQISGMSDICRHFHFFFHLSIWVIARNDRERPEGWQKGDR